MTDNYEFKISKEEVDNIFKKNTKKRVEADIERAIAGLNSSLDKVSLFSVRNKLVDMKNDLIKQIREEEDNIRLESKDRKKIVENIKDKLVRISDKIDSSLSQRKAFVIDPKDGSLVCGSMTCLYWYNGFIVMLFDDLKHLASYGVQLTLDKNNSLMNKIGDFRVEEEMGYGLEKILEDNNEFFINKTEKIDLKEIFKMAYFMYEVYDKNRYLKISLEVLMNRYFSLTKAFDNFEELKEEFFAFRDLVSLNDDLNLKVPDLK